MQPKETIIPAVVFGQFSSEEIKRFAQMGRAIFGATNGELNGVTIDLKFNLNHCFIYIFTSILTSTCRRQNSSLTISVLS